MSIEVRQFLPTDGASNVNTYSKISFNLAALDDYTVDITSLTITVSTDSNIDDETHTLEYLYSDAGVTYSGSETIGYSVELVPSIPFDFGQDVTVAVNVDGADESSVATSMEEFESSFSTVYSGLISDFRYAFINQSQRIPVHNEILRKNSTTSPTVFQSAYGRWNETPAPEIRVNEVLFGTGDTTYGHSINFENGKITFDNALDYNDAVDVSYYFSFFSDEEIQSFFAQATAQWGMFPPMGGPESIYSAGARYSGALMVGASLFAFRSILFSLAFQETRIIFDNASGNEGWIQMKDLFKTLHDAFENDWKALIEAKKLALPSIATVVVPAYTLPGGRTLCGQEKCCIGLGQYVNFESIFHMLEEGFNVKVMTLLNGKPIFSQVSSIEYEGKKDVHTAVFGSGKGMNLKTKTINTSSDHKYESSHGKMVRLKNLNKGDRAIVFSGEKAEEWTLLDKGYNGFLDCYEIEVPQTGKFLCNGISTSNSRMFRYLYKSGIEG